MNVIIKVCVHGKCRDAPDSHTKSLIATHKAFYNAQMAAELHTLVSFSLWSSPRHYTHFPREASSRRESVYIIMMTCTQYARPPPARVIIVIMLHKACIKINIEKAMIMCSPWRYLFYNALQQLYVCVCSV